MLQQFIQDRCHVGGGEVMNAAEFRCACVEAFFLGTSMKKKKKV